MKNLILATDFSSPAHNAYEYAYHLSKVMNATLTVLYVAPSTEEHFFKSEALNKKLQEVDEEKYENALRKFITKYPSKYKNDAAALQHVNVLFKKGNVIEEIIKTTESKSSELIIIGTRHKHNIWDYFFGSTSTDLIKQASVSVLIIPHQVSYVPIKNIGFANSLKLDEPISMKSIQEFTQQIGAKLQQVYIDIAATNEEIKKEKSSVFYQSSNPLKSMAIIKDKTVSTGLDYYINHHSIDLLAMFRSQQDGLEKLFHKSQTKKMTYQTKIPLLVCK